MCRADERGYVPMAEPPIYVNPINPQHFLFFGLYAFHSLSASATMASLSSPLIPPDV